MKTNAQSRGRPLRQNETLPVGARVRVGKAYRGNGRYEKDEATGDWIVVRSYAPNIGYPYAEYRIGKTADPRAYAFTIHESRIEAVLSEPGA